MKRFIIIIALATLLSANNFLFAQSAQTKNFSAFGVKVSAGIANQTDFKESIGPILGYSIGAVYTHQFNSSFSFQIEGLYSVKGSELDSYTGFYFNYFDVPFLIKKSLSNSLKNKVNLYVGLQPSLYLNGTVKYEGDEYDADNVTSPEFSIPIGADFQVGKNIYIDVRYNLGVTSIVEDSDINNISLLGGIIVYF